MALAYVLLRAAHARGTHHFLALDALTHVTDADADGWRRLLYAEIAQYVDGAKAPDTRFKDFENHVLHPRDGFWGGAPERAGHWYRSLVDALARQDWPAAAQAAGVLSHYVTDPLMPLHTHQTDAESNIHAAVERTVSKSYVRLRDVALASGVSEIAGVPVGPDWIAELLRAGAKQATRHYETILAHYDIKRGVVAPEEGLDPVGQRAIGEMLVVAARLFARILDRAFAEAGVRPPEVSLTGPALLALAKLPKAWMQKRQLDAAERATVEAMYDELMATGRVEQALTEDDRRIKESYQREVVARRPIVAVPVAVTDGPALAKMKPLARPEFKAMDVVPIAPTTVAVEPVPGPSLVTGIATDPTVVPTPPLAPGPVEQAPVTMIPVTMIPVTLIPAEPAPSPAPPTADAQTSARLGDPIVLRDEAVGEPLSPSSIDSTAPERRTVEVAVPAGATVAPVLSAYRPSPRGQTRLALEAAVVDAPSIGPKTAKRLNDVGVDTIGDFLQAHPIALAARLDAPHLTAEVLTEWQHQTHLMLRLPVLRAMHAQVLTGAGYRTVDAIADVEADQLAADVLRFATSAAGQRLLRTGGAPDLELIRSWAEQARAAKAA
jgi:hypothetical protein